MFAERLDLRSFPRPSAFLAVFAGSFAFGFRAAAPDERANVDLVIAVAMRTADYHAEHF
jgi:hypothetical protein